MTALIAARQDLDWGGLVIVLGIGVLAIGFALWEDRTYRPSLKDLIDEALDPITGRLIWAGPEVDHVDCANPDCAQTICACRQPAECTGCTTVGCDHLNRHGGLLCWDCRPECSECVAEVAAEHDMDWAAGR